MTVSESGSLTTSLLSSDARCCIRVINNSDIGREEKVLEALKSFNDVDTVDGSNAI